MQVGFQGHNLLSKSGEISAIDAFSSAPVLAIYFAANWCLVCKEFTPVLIENYNKWNAKSKEIEIVMISRDRDQAEFNEHYKELPWLALPLQEIELMVTLRNVYRIEGLPTFIIIEKSGIILNGDAREEIDIYGEKALSIFQDLYP